jgi:hypothetical protein
MLKTALNCVSPIYKEVRVYPFERDDEDESDTVVAKVRVRLNRVEISLHQLPGVGTRRSLNGGSSDNGKLGSPSWCPRASLWTGPPFACTA